MPPAARMTARGAVLVMSATFLLGTLSADWLHRAVLTGLSFVAGCALAARYTRRDALLAVTATPPLLFGVALVTAELLTSHSGSPRRTLTSAAEGTILTLAAIAPWLFCGVIVGVVIAMCRGLPGCVRDLRAQLRGDADRGGPAGTRARTGTGRGGPPR